MCLQTWVCIAYRNVLKHTRPPPTPGHIRTKESLSQLQLRLESDANGGTSIKKRLVPANLSFIAYRCVLRHARSYPAPGHIRTEEGSSQLQLRLESVQMEAPAL